MSSEAPTLLTLPDVPKKHLLERCDYASKQVLRRTCWDLRNFIDDVKIDSHVKYVDVVVGCFESTFTAMWNSFEYIRLNYCFGDPTDGWKKDDIMNWHTFHSAHFQEQFWRDFEIFLKQNSKIASLWLHLDLTVVPEEVDEILFRRIKAILEKTTVEVESLHVNIENQKNLMDILPFIKAKSLKIIFLTNERRNSLLELDEVVILDQWKFAETLSIWNCHVNANIQDFAHFSDVTIRFEKFNMEDVLEIRKAFSQNPKLTDFRLYYSNRAEDFMEQTKKTLIDQFGQSDSDGLWYLKITNSEKIIALRFTSSLISQRKDKEVVPRGTIVLE